MKIAVLEDDPLDFAALARVLGNEQQVTHWQNGTDALRAFAEQPALADQLTVIIVDLGLPDMHGAEVIRRIRALPNGHHPAIFALTGSSDPADMREVESAGADDYYVKPTSVAGLRGIAAQIADVTGFEL
ncbi:MAG: response regulator [Patulibacter minatonensis]